MSIFKSKNLTVVLTLILSVSAIGCQNNKEEALDPNTTKISIEQKIPEKEYLYVKALNSSVFDSPKSMKQIGTISRNIRVLVLERKDIEIVEKEKKKKFKR